MKSTFHGLTACLMAVLLLLALDASATERLVGLAPHDGLAVFAKAFAVSSGSTIEGVTFTTDGTSVVFPKVSLLRGPGASLHEATTVAAVENVASGTGTTVTVSWPATVEVSEDGTYYVAVQLPVAAVRLGLTDRETPNGSYIASIDEDLFVDVVGELQMILLPVEEGMLLGGAEASKAASRDPEIGVETRTFLRSGAPNPARQVTTLDFGLERSGSVNLTIYDVSGREVRHLVDGERASGPHRVQWDGRDSQGRSVAAGVYLVHLRYGEKLLTERVVIMK